MLWRALVLCWQNCEHLLSPLSNTTNFVRLWFTPYNPPFLLTRRLQTWLYSTLSVTFQPTSTKRTYKANTILRTYTSWSSTLETLSLDSILWLPSVPCICQSLMRQWGKLWRTWWKCQEVYNILREDCSSGTTSVGKPEIIFQLAPSQGELESSLL